MKLLSSLSLLPAMPHPVIGGFLTCFVLGGVAFVGVQHARTGAPAQPIAFNHAKHVANGVGCEDCHSGVQTQARATLPSIETCMTCHQTALTSSPEEAKIRKAAAAGQELPWVQLTQVAPHVFFSHRRHVAVAHLACAECHGAMEKASTPPTRAFRTLNMDACLGCHQQHSVQADCNDCHR